tara:strand:+ start:1803 stop:2735 length:933 start_codon:yes stop_codon:yes gene_type:complete
MKSARKLREESKVQLEVEMDKRRQASEYDIAKLCMDEYRNGLFQADRESRLNLQDELDQVNSDIAFCKSMKDLLPKASSKRTPFQQTRFEEVTERLGGYQERKKEIRTELKTASRGVDRNEGIELIINRYNGTTDVILPVMDTDLGKEGKTLAEKLYESVSDSLETYDVQEESSFKGYKVISVNNKHSRDDIAKVVMDTLPQEFAGKKATIYVRMAKDFSFSYVKPTVAPSPSVEGHPTTIMADSNGSQPITVPTGNEVTREYAIKLRDEQGLTSPKIHAQYPGTPMMTIAGWFSDETKKRQKAAEAAET